MLKMGISDFVYFLSEKAHTQTQTDRQTQTHTHTHTRARARARARTCTPLEFTIELSERRMQ